jgi:hypothetical protein
LSYALALVPAWAALVVGRVVACVAWFGVLGWMAATARRQCRENAIAAAALVGGIWVLANFAMVTRPDSLACAFAALGLTRAMRKQRMDLLSIVLLVLAPWVKPTIIGLPAGALLADAIVRRRPQTLALAAGAAAAIGIALYAASDGALFEHVIRSNAQPLTLAIWLERVPPRLPFFAPLFALALWHGLEKRAEPSIAIGVGALVGGIVWTVIAIAKTGSAANYWMEPCVAAVALVAHAPGPFVFGRSSLTHAAAALVCAAYTHSASIPSALAHTGLYRRETAFAESVRDRCGASADDVVASDEQGAELALDGRILTPAYQMAWLVHAGKYPAELWARDLAAANVRCFLVHSNALDVAPDVARAVEQQFSPIATDGDFRLLRKR